jgi:hypothetical protein
MKFSLKIRLAALVALLACTTFAEAQNQPGQWVGDKYLIQEGGTYPWKQMFVGEGNEVLQTFPHISEVANFPVPKDDRQWSFTPGLWRNDVLYTVAWGTKKIKEKDGTEITRHIFAKWSENEWHFLGEYRTERSEFIRAIPCDDDKFIVITSKKDLTDNKRTDRSPFCRMSVHPNLDKKEIKLDASIPFRCAVDGWEKYSSDSEFFKIAANGDVIMTDEYAVVINKRNGLFWIFSLEKASLVRYGAIFKNLTPEIMISGELKNAILRTNPQKDGTILLSALEEADFMTEKRDFSKEANEYFENNPDLTVGEVDEYLASLSKELRGRSPHLVWYQIYPENGKIEKLSVPPMGAAYVRDKDKGDDWRPMPDGSVQMGLMRLKREDKTRLSKGDKEDTENDDDYEQEQAASGEDSEDTDSSQDDD